MGTLLGAAQLWKAQRAQNFPRELGQCTRGEWKLEAADESSPTPRRELSLFY